MIYFKHNSANYRMAPNIFNLVLQKIILGHTRGGMLLVIAPAPCESEGFRLVLENPRVHKCVHEAL